MYLAQFTCKKSAKEKKLGNMKCSWAHSGCFWSNFAYYLSTASNTSDFFWFLQKNLRCIAVGAKPCAEVTRTNMIALLSVSIQSLTKWPFMDYGYFLQDFNNSWQIVKNGKKKKLKKLTPFPKIWNIFIHKITTYIQVRFRLGTLSTEQSSEVLPKEIKKIWWHHI